MYASSISFQAGFFVVVSLDKVPPGPPSSTDPPPVAASERVILGPGRSSASALDICLFVGGGGGASAAVAPDSASHGRFSVPSVVPLKVKGTVSQRAVESILLNLQGFFPLIVLQYKY